MESKKDSRTPGLRLKEGAVILAAAQIIDTKDVQQALDEFTSAHRQYVDAVKEADDADLQVATAKTQVAKLEAEQDEAIEELARCLVSDRRPRGKPFTGFSTETPASITAMPGIDKVKVAQLLAAAVQADRTLSKASRTAAASAGQKGVALAAALAPLGALRNSARAARQARDRIGRTWDMNFTALRHAARVADGRTPGLYIALLGLPGRVAKPAKPEPPTAKPETPAEPIPPPPEPPTPPVG